MSVLWGPQGLLNPGRQYPKRLANAVTAAAAVPVTSPKYKQLLLAATEAGVETQPTIWVYNLYIIAGTKPNVRGLTPNPVQLQFEGVCVAASA
jgi:peptide/nickel transport system substrate-binding protein